MPPTKYAHVKLLTVNEPKPPFLPPTRSVVEGGVRRSSLGRVAERSLSDAVPRVSFDVLVCKLCFTGNKSPAVERTKTKQTNKKQKLNKKDRKKRKEK